eukprot:CAMPEP_0177420816 /NCGR_PEP_ID=MMETSP0368-20130122/70457_1 /TAXON_ID=447022 ORGANISM="Scrippsiella hangoei-like, Strain SHHI-4" /NCGR_SAMPLE_ID=MMETSP0368 /ASSEMBLY_ACC=CAM_ASM_000363 /LENGTH=349 /DNA_ID=CAMNT_0018890633 /DNA_START=16 /DNA_END=1061 /DNA_ORIENTATION=+
MGGQAPAGEQAAAEEALGLGLGLSAIALAPPAAAASAPTGGDGVGAEGRLLSAGQELIRRLKDPSSDPKELFDTVGHAVARKEFAGMLRARDERRRSPLHVATSRGDLRLCQEMIKADPGIVNEVDSQRNTPIMEAALHGRSLIVQELLKHAAEVTRKNQDCMNALQLACVNEGAGNGEVVQQLVEAAADPAELCWQTSPLMAAADSGHIWSVQILIELGADPWQTNGSGMTALDYARDMETAQLLYDVMQGDRLSNSPAPRFDTQKLFKDADARRARLHRAAREVALEDAFAALEVPAPWLPGFRESGEHFNEIRKAWRRICLTCHPDKQPEDLEGDAAAEAIAKFHA